MDSVSVYRYSLGASLRVTDEDSADFLQSQFSAELRPFEAGRLVYGLWLDVKGKVLADSTVLCCGEEDFLLLSEHASGQVIHEQLEKHIIADDVVIERAELGTAYTIIGEASADFWAHLDCVPSTDGFVETDVFFVFPGRRGFNCAYEIVCKHASAEKRVESAIEAFKFRPIDEAALPQQRIAAGIALIPQEIGPSDLPGEGGLVEKEAVSLTKGCYLGQEVVARMHNVGRPQRGLFKVSGVGLAPTCPSDLKNDASKVVGQLRSAYVDGENWFGVALLKTRYVEPGVSLQNDDFVVNVNSVL